MLQGKYTNFTVEHFDWVIKTITTNEGQTDIMCLQVRNPESDTRLHSIPAGYAQPESNHEEITNPK